MGPWSNGERGASSYRVAVRVSATGGVPGHPDRALRGRRLDDPSALARNETEGQQRRAHAPVRPPRGGPGRRDGPEFDAAPGPLLAWRLTLATTKGSSRCSSGPR